MTQQQYLITLLKDIYKVPYSALEIASIISQRKGSWVNLDAVMETLERLVKSGKVCKDQRQLRDRQGQIQTVITYQLKGQ